MLDVVSKGTHIQFLDAGFSDTGKTHIWDVATIEDKEDLLGEIRFAAGWYCYAFFPSPKTQYEKTCLREIADFCEEQTKKWRTSRFNSQQTKSEKP
jgi:hypothetical protein